MPKKLVIYLALTAGLGYQPSNTCMQQKTLSQKQQKGLEWVQDDREKTTPCVGDTQSFASDFMKKNWPKGKESTAGTVERDLAKLRPLIITKPDMFRFPEEKNNIYHQAHMNLARALLSNEWDKILRRHIRINQELFDAVSEKSLKGVQAALAAGAKILSQDKESDGRTPLHRACLENSPEIVEFLLQSGADPNIKGEHCDEPLLEIVIESEDNVFEIVKLLLQFGANPSVQGPDNDRVLIWAFRGCSTKTVKLLLSKQAMLPPLRELLSSQKKQTLLWAAMYWTALQDNQQATQVEIDRLIQHPRDFIVLLFRNGMIKKLMPRLNQNQRDILVTAFFTELRGDSRQTYFDADACIVAEQLREWVREDLWERGFARMDMQFTKTYLNMKACQKMQTKLAQSLAKNLKMRDLTFDFDNATK